MKVDYPSSQICAICVHDDDVTHAKLAPGIYEYTCTGRYHDAPRVWEVDATGATFPAWEGVMGELGLYEDLPRCLVAGEPFVEYGVVEHRYSTQFPKGFAAVLARHPHRRDQKGLDYSASMFIASALSRLQREGDLLKKFGKATGSWSYNGEISYWALAPQPGPGPDLTWAAYDEGEDPADEDSSPAAATRGKPEGREHDMRQAALLEVSSGPVASPMARQAVRLAIEGLRSSEVSYCTPPELFGAANDAAWNGGVILSQSDVWSAVYEWGGHDYNNPPPDNTMMRITDGHD